MAGKAIIHIKLKSMKPRSKLFSFYNYMESKFVLPGIKATQKVTVSRREPGGGAAPLAPSPAAPAALSPPVRAARPHAGTGTEMELPWCHSISPARRGAAHAAATEGAGTARSTWDPASGPVPASRGAHPHGPELPAGAAPAPAAGSCSCPGGRGGLPKPRPPQSCFARAFCSNYGSLFAFRSLPSFLSEQLSWLSHLFEQEPALKQGCSV